MSQSRMIRYAPRVDFVGHLETLESDVETIAAQITGAAGEAPLSIVSVCDRRIGLAGEMYDDECRAPIEQVYAEDFARFGYSKGIL